MSAATSNGVRVRTVPPILNGMLDFINCVTRSKADAVHQSTDKKGESNTVER